MTLRLLSILFCLAAAPLHAAPDVAADFAFDQALGAAVPADAVFRAADGHRLRIGALFGARPLVLALGYFECPSLCSTVRDDLFAALAQSGLEAGADYDVAALSIDPAETPSIAARAKADDLARHPAPGADRGWHFLVGEGAATAAVAASVGFKSRYDQHLRQFLHPAGLVVLSPAGRVSGYVLGVGYRAAELRDAIRLAASGGVAAAASPLLLLCFHFDAVTGRYSLSILKVLRAAGFLTVLTIVAGLLLALRREHRRRGLERGGSMAEAAGRPLGLRPADRGATAGDAAP